MDDGNNCIFQKSQYRIPRSQSWGATSLCLSHRFSVDNVMKIKKDPKKSSEPLVQLYNKHGQQRSKAMTTSEQSHPGFFGTPEIRNGR